MSCAHETDGQNGMIVKTNTDTYAPLLRVGASSDITASELLRLRVYLQPYAQGRCVKRHQAAGLRQTHGRVGHETEEDHVTKGVT